MLAEKLVEQDHQVFPIAPWRNPSLVDAASNSDGMFFQVADLTDGQEIASITKEVGADMFISNMDMVLKANVAGIVKRELPDVDVPCPDGEVFNAVEGNKTKLRELIGKVDKKYNPIYFPVSDYQDIEEAVDYFESEGIEMVVKPGGLTAGKGVRVMGPHFQTYKEGRKYAQTLVWDLDQAGSVIEEKLEGPEFTFEAYTDGESFVPNLAYDHPFRDDGDKGPGTGGMGSFTMPKNKLLPFLNQRDYNEASQLMSRVLAQLKSEGHDFKGNLFGSFIKTKKGLKIIEFNARGGDPEYINGLGRIDDNVDIYDFLHKMARGGLKPDDIKFKKAATLVRHYVTPEYAREDREPFRHRFKLNKRLAEAFGCRVLFAAAVRDDGIDEYITTGPSRTFGFYVEGRSPMRCREKADQADEAALQGLLEHRDDIGKRSYIRNLKRFK